MPILRGKKVEQVRESAQKVKFGESKVLRSKKGEKRRETHEGGTRVGEEDIWTYTGKPNRHKKKKKLSKKDEEGSTLLR